MKTFKLSDLEGVGPIGIKKLNKAGIFTPLDVVIRGAKEFSRVSGIGTDVSAKHLKTMKKLLAESGLDIIVDDIKSLKALRSNQIRVPLKVEQLDEMTKGGFETQSLYEIYGVDGCGKTQMVMTVLAEALGAGHGVVFVDCEGTFDIDRFEQICQSRGITYDEDKLGYHLYSDETELDSGIKNMTDELLERDVRYMVIDGLVGLMRLAYGGRSELNERQIELKFILKYLKNISILFNICVIITNQVTADPGGWGADTKPIGGYIMGHYVKYIYAVIRGQKNKRNVRLVKSPSSPQGDYECFLTEEGVSQYDSIKARDRARKIDTVAVENGSIKRTDLLTD